MTSRIPSERESQAGHAVLIEVLTVLGKYGDGMVLIGGWVPDLLFPNAGHIGSFDVDFALDERRIAPDAYQSIRQRLVGQGYVQASIHAGVFTKDLGVGDGVVTVKLDLVTGERSGEAGGPPMAIVQDLRLGRLRGVELALDHTINVTVTGVLPSGAETTVVARAVTVPAYLCLKAFALNERLKEKDAYDVYFCLRQYEGGPVALARACSGLLALSRVREAMVILNQKFETLRSVGPQWAADVAAGQGDDWEFVSRDAFERAQRFLREVTA